MDIKDKLYRNKGNQDVLKYLIEPSDVLDVGCGVGDNAEILQSRGFQVDGITISDEERLQATKFLRNTYLFDLEKGLPPETMLNKYDYIICSHVLEHICYPENLLRDIKSCLKDKGQLIVALPNIMHYKSRLKLLKGDFDYSDAGIYDNTHFKWYTFKTGKNLLKDAGFEIKVATVTGKLPWNSMFSKLLPAEVSKSFYNKVKMLVPGLLGYQLVYVVGKSA